MKLIKMMPAGLMMLLLFLSGSCTTESELGDTYIPGLAFTASIEIPREVNSRMGEASASQSFTVGDKIGLYAVAYQNQNEPYPINPSLNSADNALYIAEINPNLVFNSDSPIRFPSGAVKLLDLYAYYPYNTTGFVQATTTLPVAVKLDQSLEENFWLSDFMTAEEKKVDQQRATSTDEGKRLKFEFHHRFSLVSFEVKQGIEFVSLAELGNPTLQVINLANEGTYDWTKELDNRLTLSTSRDGKVIPNGTLVVEEGAEVYSGLTALLLPQTISKDTPVCQVKAGGMTFHCKLTSDLTLEPGCSYVFTLTLNKSEMSGINFALAAWNTSRISGNVSPDLPIIPD